MQFRLGPSIGVVTLSPKVRKCVASFPLSFLRFHATPYRSSLFAQRAPITPPFGARASRIFPSTRSPPLVPFATGSHQSEGPPPLGLAIWLTILVEAGVGWC